MWKVETYYKNIKTGRLRKREYSFDGEQMFLEDRDRYIFALLEALDYVKKREVVHSLVFHSCE